MKKNILYVNHVSKISGSEVSLINLIKGLDKNQFNPYLLSPEYGILTEELEKLDVKIIKANLPREFRKNLRFLPDIIKLFKLVKNYKIDLIHANSFVAGYSIALVAKLAGIPLITHIRDIVYPEFFNLKVESRLLKMSNTFICISKAVEQNLLINGFDIKKIQVIYNGVNTKLFNPSSDENTEELLPTMNNGLKFGLIGQVIEWKGHEDFIDAISILSNKGYKANFYIIGSPLFNDSSYLEFLINRTKLLGIGNTVKFIPFQKNVLPLMKSLDVIVCPSWNEPFGRVIIEAMSLAKTVIATKMGGPLEIINNDRDGILVDPKNPEELSKAFIRLITNKELLINFGYSGRKRVLDMFNIDNHIKEIEKVYKKLTY